MGCIKKISTIKSLDDRFLEGFCEVVETITKAARCFTITPTWIAALKYHISQATKKEHSLLLGGVFPSAAFTGWSCKNRFVQRCSRIFGHLKKSGSHEIIHSSMKQFYMILLENCVYNLHIMKVSSLKVMLQDYHAAPLQENCAFLICSHNEDMKLSRHDRSCLRTLDELKLWTRNQHTLIQMCLRWLEKKYSPNGDLIVIYDGRIRKESPTKHTKVFESWIFHSNILVEYPA